VDLYAGTAWEYRLYRVDHYDHYAGTAWEYR
jgi:hypothetical protein